MFQNKNALVWRVISTFTAHTTLHAGFVGRAQFSRPRFGEVRPGADGWGGSMPRGQLLCSRPLASQTLGQSSLSKTACVFVVLFAYAAFAFRAAVSPSFVAFPSRRWCSVPPQFSFSITMGFAATLVAVLGVTFAALLGTSSMHDVQVHREGPGCDMSISWLVLPSSGPSLPCNRMRRITHRSSLFHCLCSGSRIPRCGCRVSRCWCWS